MNYIYMIQFPNNKVYIGQTNNIIRRFNNYKRKNCYNQKHLYNAINKYGFQNLQIRILAVCNNSNVDEYERGYISAFASNEVGYNIESGGNKNKTFVMSEEAKRNISKSLKNKKKSKEHNKKVSKSLTGRTLSEAHKIKLSIAHKGQIPWNKNKKEIYSDETMEKMRKSHEGKKFSDITKNKMKLSQQLRRNKKEIQQ